MLTVTPLGFFPPSSSADRAGIFMRNFMGGSGVYGTHCTALDPKFLEQEAQGILGQASSWAAWTTRWSPGLGVVTSTLGERFPQVAMPEALSVPHASDVDRGVSSRTMWGTRILCSWTRVSF